MVYKKPSMPSMDIRNFLGYSVSRSLWDAVPYILEGLIKRLGEEDYHDPGYVDFTNIGQGHFAQVYWLQDKKKILKVTTDYSDAKACMILKNKPSKYLLHTYDVFRFVKNEDLFGIVAEKLNPISSSEEIRINDIAEFLLEVDNWGRLASSNIDILEEQVRNKEIPLQEEDIQLLRKWENALTKRGIAWQDLHPGNVMVRGRDLVLVDLGFSKSPSVRIPNLVWKS